MGYVKGTTLLKHTSLKVLTLTKGYIVAVCGYELLNERKTASLGQCRFTIGKTGVQPTLQTQ